MKKLLIITVLSIGLMSCTQNKTLVYPYTAKSITPIDTLVMNKEVFVEYLELWKKVDFLYSFLTRDLITQLQREVLSNTDYVIVYEVEAELKGKTKTLYLLDDGKKTWVKAEYSQEDFDPEVKLVQKFDSIMNDPLNYEIAKHRYNIVSSIGK